MKANTFQVALYVIFGLFLLVGFGSLAGYGLLKKNSTDNNEKVDVVVWGTLDSRIIEPLFEIISENSFNKPYESVTYIEKNPLTIEQEYINSISVYKNPDLLLVDHNMIFDIENTLYFNIFSVDTFTFSQYQNTFFNKLSNIFLLQDTAGSVSGYLALPFLSDSMVLYYNENLRLKEKISEAELPTKWSDFTSDFYLNIGSEYIKNDRALVPLGAHSNYGNSADLVASLIHQLRESGNNIDRESVKKVLDYYTTFSNPTSDYYYWRNSFPDAMDMFVGGNLLFYPGYISEYDDLLRSNPNIPIKVAPLPQLFADKEDSTPTESFGGSRERSNSFGGEITVGDDSVEVVNSIVYAFAVPNRIRGYTAAQQGVQYRANLLAAYDIATYGLNTDISTLINLPPVLNKFNLSNFEKREREDIVFAKSLILSRSVHLTKEDRNDLDSILQRISVGVLSTGLAAYDILNLGLFR